MRILPDISDLINLVQHARPTTTQSFEHYLRAGNHEIILSFTNVRELAGPLAAGAEFLQLRPFFQSLEQMPHSYIKEVQIIADEIQSTVDAFKNRTRYQAPSPYVRRWDDTLLMVPDQPQAATANLVNLRLHEIIYYIRLARPDVFAPPTRHLGALQAQFQNDRAQLRLGQAPGREHFVHSLMRHAATWGVHLPDGQEVEFAEWIYANPDRCPGLRLHHEVYRALMANYGDIPETGDFSDLAHISAVPYVDAVTLDRRMRHYCGLAARTVSELGGANNYGDRLFEDLADLMRKNP